MGKVRSRLLIVDASIARSAGPEKSVYPTSRACREFLQAILRICHRVVFTEAIQAEWDEHQSGFARRWRLSMFAHRKINRVTVEPDDALRNLVSTAADDDAITAILLKDCHLIEAACSTEMRITSLDEKARNHFRNTTETVQLLRAVCWVNPDVPLEEAIQWLENNAPLDRHRLLGFKPPEA